MTGSLLQTHLRKRMRYVNSSKMSINKSSGSNDLFWLVPRLGTRLFEMSTVCGSIGTGRVREQRNRHNVGNSSSGKCFHMCGGGSRHE